MALSTRRPFPASLLFLLLVAAGGCEEPAPVVPDTTATPATAPSPSVAMTTTASGSASASATTQAPTGVVDTAAPLPKGTFLVARARGEESLGVVDNGKGEALVFAGAEDRSASFAPRFALVSADGVKRISRLDGLEKLFPKGAEVDNIVGNAGGDVAAIAEVMEPKESCRILTAGASAGWSVVGDVERDGMFGCNFPIHATPGGAIVVAGGEASKGPTMLGFGKVDKASLPAFARYAGKGKDFCGVYTTVVFGFKRWESGDAISVGVPCGTPRAVVERFTSGSKASVAKVLDGLVLDSPSFIEFVSPDEVWLRNAIGDDGTVDLQLKFQKGGFKEVSRAPGKFASPEDAKPSLKSEDFDVQPGVRIGKDVYTVIRQKQKSKTAPAYPRLLVRDRAVSAPIDFAK